jgi:hypothetical protein
LLGLDERGFRVQNAYGNRDDTISGSALERKATAFACSFGSRKDKKIYSKINTVQELEFKLKSKDDPVLGQDFALTIRVRNISDNDRTFVLRMSAVASFYTGVPAEKITKEEFNTSIKGHECK